MSLSAHCSKISNEPCLDLNYYALPVVWVWAVRRGRGEEEREGGERGRREYKGEREEY